MLRLVGRSVESSARLASCALALPHSHLHSDHEQHGDSQELFSRGIERLGDELSEAMKGATSLRPTDGVSGSRSSTDQAAAISGSKRKLDNTQQITKYKRSHGARRLTSRDQTDLASTELTLAIAAQARARMRYTWLRKTKPDVFDLEGIATWHRNMSLDLASKQEADSVVKKLRAAQPKTLGWKPRTKVDPERPRDFIGLTEHEMDLFQSGEASSWSALRARLRRRIQRAQTTTAIKGPADRWNLPARLRADQAWMELMDLLKTALPEIKDKHVADLAADVHGLSSVEAAERALALVSKLKAEAPAEASIGQIGIGSSRFAASASHAPLQPEGQTSVHGSQHRSVSESLSASLSRCELTYASRFATPKFRLPAIHSEQTQQQSELASSSGGPVPPTHSAANDGLAASEVPPHSPSSSTNSQDFFAGFLDELKRINEPHSSSASQMQ